ncbi:hypothetical protein NDI76_02695 [Halogeometricum sp. S1BR25-6]|uniref:Uncharacterized protein n=1 Tax=Halogeometricum salsisoli TaxID=2950536 RepID=A0ABU2GA09_9EURY|nr:hypothetical protein [Halogeometricum sp. S1BR25-6]MDS0297647.1 hypothetical protein [Halogeometricum sp. S1BR25-6]
MVDIGGGDDSWPVPQVSEGERGSSENRWDVFWFLLPVVLVFVVFVAALYVW